MVQLRNPPQDTSPGNATSHITSRWLFCSCTNSRCGPGMMCGQCKALSNVPIEGKGMRTCTFVCLYASIFHQTALPHATTCGKSRATAVGSRQVPGTVDLFWQSDQRRSFLGAFLGDMTSRITPLSAERSSFGREQREYPASAIVFWVGDLRPKYPLVIHVLFP